MNEEEVILASNRDSDLLDARILLKKLADRVTSQRFRAYDQDELFLKFCRCYSQHLTAVNAIERDRQLDRIEEKLSYLLAEREHEKERDLNDNSL